MSEFEQQVEFNKQLVTILDKLLNTGDWESSLFLKVASKRVKALREEAKSLLEYATAEQTDTDNRDLLLEGYAKVFISLYQADGHDMKKWQTALKSLALKSIGRPVYKEETDVQASIRARGNAACEGYVEVHIKIADLIQMPDGRVPKDRYGNELLTMRENAVTLHSIKSFVHANGQSYTFKEGELIAKVSV